MLKKDSRTSGSTRRDEADGAYRQTQPKRRQRIRTPADLDGCHFYAQRQGSCRSFFLTVRLSFVHNGVIEREIENIVHDQLFGDQAAVILRIGVSRHFFGNNMRIGDP